MIRNFVQYYRRTFTKLSQAEFAKSIGISRTELCLVENNKKQPNIQTLLKIKNFLNKQDKSYKLLIDNLIYESED